MKNYATGPSRCQISGRPSQKYHEEKGTRVEGTDDVARAADASRPAQGNKIGFYEILKI